MTTISRADFVAQGGLEADFGRLDTTRDGQLDHAELEALARKDGTPGSISARDLLEAGIQPYRSNPTTRSQELSGTARALQALAPRVTGPGGRGAFSVTVSADAGIHGTGRTGGRELTAVELGVLKAPENLAAAVSFTESGGQLAGLHAEFRYQGGFDSRVGGRFGIAQATLCNWASQALAAQWPATLPIDAQHPVRVPPPGLRQAGGAPITELTSRDQLREYVIGQMVDRLREASAGKGNLLSANVFLDMTRQPDGSMTLRVDITPPEASNLREVPIVSPQLGVAFDISGSISPNEKMYNVGALYQQLTQALERGQIAPPLTLSMVTFDNATRAPRQYALPPLTPESMALQMASDLGLGGTAQLRQLQGALAEVPGEQPAARRARIGAFLDGVQQEITLDTDGSNEDLRGAIASLRLNLPLEGGQMLIFTDVRREDYQRFAGEGITFVNPYYATRR